MINSKLAPGTILEMSPRGGVLIQCKKACIRTYPYQSSLSSSTDISPC